MASTLYTYIKRGLNEQHACSCECMTYLAYLAASQHLWHYVWTCECMFMVFKQGTTVKPSPRHVKEKQVYEQGKQKLMERKTYI